MKTFNANTLIDRLQGDIRNMLLAVSQLQQQPAAVLETPPAPGGWSIAQVMEHLNIYCRYYITTIEQALHLNNTSPETRFKPGWLGNYFTGLMQPVAGQTIKKKMKAPKSAIPAAQPDARQMLEEFTAHQHHLLQLLQIARSANIGRIRIPTSISKWIRLKLGDTFRFLIAHQERHFVQIERVLRQSKTAVNRA
ncbi:DinB family protein [Taibaiella chishuiensis]|uniref:DinB family protein n=1 Tax=Taibaiella chishuiensis TaxID=1434707 RepID=A0A2P8D1S6_9BACT|nr:DinB family protein [Taibaiella chishuiensis]PSK91162.1 DinB family protein [Taibaiella chishuiensis]